MASKHNFEIQSVFVNVCKYYFATINHPNWFSLQNSVSDFYSNFLGLSNGGQASHKETRPLTGRSVLSQGGQASQREVGPLTERLGLSKEGQASRRESGFSKGGGATPRETRPLVGRPGLSKGGRVSLR